MKAQSTLWSRGPIERTGVTRAAWLFIAMILAIAALSRPTIAASPTPFSGTPVSIPGTIQAENFDNGGEGVAYHDNSSTNLGGAYRQTGVDLEASSEGGYDVAWTGRGEWLNYSVRVATSGSYTVQVRVASPYGATVHVGFNGGSSVWKSLNVPNTGGWQRWTTVSFPATLAAGQQLLTVMFDTGNVNLNSVTVVSATSTTTSTTSTSTSGATPFTGTPAAIPGTIEAEKFDNGGEGVAYHDTGSSNAGGAYRSTGVDIENSSEGGYNVGWTASGEWLMYTVNVASSASYTVQLRVASPYGATMHVGFDGSTDVWKAVSIPNTGGWQRWTTVSFTTTIGSGKQMMKVYFDNGAVNLNKVTVASGTTTTAPPPAPTTSSTDVPVATWNVRVDSSASHARAVMDKFVAMNPRPKIIVIQEAYQSLFDTYIDELRARTGVTWTGVFKSHCPPGGWNGSSCTRSEEEGVAIFTTLPIQSSSSLYFPYGDSWHSARAAVRAAVSVNGVTVQVFSVHLIPNNATARYASMSMLKNWAAKYSKPQIVGGDFNADPDQIRSSSGMSTAFVDASLLAASGNQNTAFSSSPTMKLDYWFSDSSRKANPQWAVVPSTGGTSDHLPVLVSYRVSP